MWGWPAEAWIGAKAKVIHKASSTMNEILDGFTVIPLKEIDEYDSERFEERWDSMVFA
jgi:hypothetical protein